MLWWPGESSKLQPEAGLEARQRRQLRCLRRLPGPGQRPEHRLHRGYEIQIDATDDLDSTTGSIYNFQRCGPAARDSALKPAGQWNAYEIMVEGQRIQVFLNGVQDQRLHQHRPEPDDRARLHRPAEPRSRRERVLPQHPGQEARSGRECRAGDRDRDGDPRIRARATGGLLRRHGHGPGRRSLTYAWDLDGDGTFETNGQTPSRTYDTPRLYAPAVRVTDPDGASATRTLAVSVQPATTKTEVPGSVGGTVPGVLALSLGGVREPRGVHARCRSRLHGVAHRTVTSSESAAALTVHDPSTTATGRLVNGPWSLPQPLQMRAGSGAFAPLSRPVLHCR